MDVHVNRVPVSGQITRVSYRRGRFLPAYRHDAGTVNERSEIWIDHDGQGIVARQIVGFSGPPPRRLSPGDGRGRSGVWAIGHGVMKFGSRMDVFVPESAAICVKEGDMVRGGETIIAVLH